jgi:AGZA family xanthine/uracil permease-like MFS transporter
VEIGDVTDQRVWISLCGLMLICVLLTLDFKGAMLLGMLGVTIAEWVSGAWPAPEKVVAIPSFTSTWWMLDFNGYAQEWRKTVPATFVLLFVSVLDTAGVQIMAGEQANLLDSHHKLPGSKSAFMSAGFATSIGALLGTSPIIIHNETCAGIQDGARTGLAALTTSFCFLLSMPFIPVFSAIPPTASAAPLVVVGVFMMSAAKLVNWDRMSEAVPAFLTLTLIPFTYSIANGMVGGLLMHVVLKVISREEVKKEDDFVSVSPLVRGVYGKKGRKGDEEHEPHQPPQGSLNSHMDYGRKNH